MFQSFGETSFSDFPKTIAQTLIEGSSSPMSMDFHPVQHTLLLGSPYKICLVLLNLWLLFNISFLTCSLNNVAGVILSWNQCGGHRIVGC